MKPASVLAVLVLLTAVAASAWVVWGDGSNPASAANQVSTPDPTPRLPYVEPEPDPLVTPPYPVVFSRRDKPGSFLKSGVLTDAEVSLLTRTGVVRVTGTVTRNETGTTLGVWRFTVRDTADPWDALAALDRHYEAGGHELEPTNHRGLLLRKSRNATSAVFHGHYVHGRDVLRVEGYGPDATPAVTALVDQQLTRSPGEER
ncbi:hypothetical protein B0I31_105377 [Saccharothrix carnea]|uniref:Uncharacterized protein n=1 Tax=Saccharothrix carnea TaxID=1280637 RepID=A0A2P8IAD4_SACCR|nr:hypothetical protein [Saccharothrix carnea]PSL55415.1 hypothetical protein B0I31_105377 [Saccharothrix carnea]